MELSALELVDFRNYASLHLELSPGVTVLLGGNGQGKTNLLEAIAYLATLSSFRGVPDAALIRDGADAAVIRAHGQREGRRLLLESELRRTGRNRTMVNRQALRRSRDLLGALRVTVFAPDDLELVKGSPAGRRRYLDDLAVALDPPSDAVRSDFDRILKQRNALLKQARGQLTPEIASTLDVWDVRFVQAATTLGELRARLVAELRSEVDDAYRELAGIGRRADLEYDPLWRAQGATEALAEARVDDVRRGVTTIGPHRDDIVLTLGGEAARTHASQGEQRTFALALRLAGHRLVTRVTGTAPILLLDDVFSELDASRRAGLIAHLRAGQTLVTAAADVPVEAHPDRILEVTSGTIHDTGAPRVQKW